jgi:hypothetical protein
LQTVRHAAMATVNENGTPHNTPYLFMRDDKLKHLYWGSHPDSEHSRNILRTGQLFVVLYEAGERGGLYILGVDGHPLEGAELQAALKVHNRIRQSRGDKPLPLRYYEDDSPQRMWGADIVQLWVNGTKRGEDGLVIQDIRTEIQPSDLL